MTTNQNQPADILQFLLSVADDLTGEEFDVCSEYLDLPNDESAEEEAYRLERMSHVWMAEELAEHQAQSEDAPASNYTSFFTREELHTLVTALAGYHSWHSGVAPKATIDKALALQTRFENLLQS